MIIRRKVGNCNRKQSVSCDLHIDFEPNVKGGKWKKTQACYFAEFRASDPDKTDWLTTG